MLPAEPSPAIVYQAAWGVLAGRHGARPWVIVESDGRIRATGFGETPRLPQTLTHDLGNVLLLPGFVNAHSHAFQRAIRGATHAPTRTEDDFWSWRTSMYREAARLDPDAFEASTRATFRECLARGITTVGEFHYLHHDADGRAYADPNELSRRVIAAAQAVGIRVVMLEALYERAGAGLTLDAVQRRFCDASVAAYLERVDTLRMQGHRVGIAPHSVRAVTRASLTRLVEYAHTHDLPLHMHVSEQPAENDQCRAEHGLTPMQLCDTVGALARPRTFTAVHAIHVDDDDLARLREQIVCACPTTEADLGDGIVMASRFWRQGTSLALGSDSNATIDLVQEARLLEMHERLRTQRRICLADEDRPLGETLLDAATRHGAVALGLAHSVGSLTAGLAFDAVAIDLNTPVFADLPLMHALDILFTTGITPSVARVYVGGRRVV